MVEFIFTCDLWFSPGQITVVGSQSKPHTGDREGKASGGVEEEVTPFSYGFKQGVHTASVRSFTPGALLSSRDI